MVQSSNPTPSPEQLALLRWTVRMGAVTAEALAVHGGWTLASARARLQAAERGGLLRSRRLLAGRPALYTANAAGLRDGACTASSRAGSALRAPRTRSNAPVVAAALEPAYPDHR